MNVIVPRIHRYERVESTQDLLHQLAADGALAGTVVFAREQTGGRGSRGRAWQSPVGGLWVSVLCRPPDPLAASVLSIRVALAVAGVLDGLGSSEPVGLKWPNDLMLRQRKLGGILCEARWQGRALGWVAVGIGLNVANAIPPDLQERAIRLAELRPGIGPEGLIEPLAAAVGNAAERAGALALDELRAFAARDWLAGRGLLEPIPGIAAGITATGELLVRQSDGSLATCLAGPLVLAADLP